MSQVGLVPITASRPYGCFLPQCILADLQTSRWHGNCRSWLSCHHTPSFGMNADHSITLLRLLFFRFTLNHVSCRLKPRTSTLSAPILHVVSECRAQSEMPWHTQSFLLGCENRDPATVGEIAQLPAVDLRSEGAQDASAVVHSCMLAMLDCSRFIEQDSLFYCVAGILPLNGQKSEAGNILTTNFLESCRWFFIFYFFKGRSIDLKQS